MNQIYVNAMRVPKIVRSPFYNNCATLSDDNTLNPSSIMYVRSLVTLNQGLRQNGKTNNKKKDRKQISMRNGEMRDQRKRRKMNTSGDKKRKREKNMTVWRERKDKKETTVNNEKKQQSTSLMMMSSWRMFRVHRFIKFLSCLFHP